ncbi:MAG TPA: hypothetical protein VE714_03325 [Gemmatimonadales bacterium]|nr:hypothetical protein [Gemmatimonadales bacterium]
MTRTLAVSLALVAMLPRIGTAQVGRSFKDSWFWGAKVGGIDFNSATQTHQQAPLGGIDWLITRTRGGLYVSYSQALFTDLALIQTSVDASDTIPHIVSLKNMRRLDVAAMVFPGTSFFVHPYAGIGFSIKQINSAEPADTSYSSIDQYNTIQAYIAELRTGASPFFIAGTQFKLVGFSIFFQGTASPAQKNMFLYNGKAFHLTYEGGIRWNFGSSIDKM